MEKIQSYEQYSKVLSDFKEGRARCTTNKLMTREELTALIVADKLFYEQIGETLWFFTNEGYYYTGVYYVPGDKAIEMHKQDMDVTVDLMGKGDRYDERRDAELGAVGFEKKDKHLEYGSQLDEIIDEIKRQNKVMHAFWEKRGCTYRTATRRDYPALREQWLETIGQERYTVTAMTDAELEDMERYGRCTVICDPQGNIVASSCYFKSNVVAYVYITETVFHQSGLGPAAAYERSVHGFEEGCKREMLWIRVDNQDSINTFASITFVN